MSSFKYKPDKVKYLTKVETLDTMHRSIISEFNAKKNSLPSMKMMLKNMIDELSNININDYEDSLMYIKKRTLLMDKIESLEKEISDIENDDNELDYYGVASDFIFDYYTTNSDNNNDEMKNYDECEKYNVSKKNNLSNIDNDINITDTYEEVKIKNDMIDVKNNVLYWEQDGINNAKLLQLQLNSQKNRKMKKPTKKRVRKEEKTSYNHILNYLLVQQNDNNTNNTTEEKHTTEVVVSNKATLHSNYMRIVKHVTLDKDPDSKNKLIICSACDIEKTTFHSEGISVCPKCGETEPIIIESEMLSHKDTVVEKYHYPYKRMNHLVEWLNQFQAKETTEIHESIYEDIMYELTKMKKTAKKHITVQRVRSILKQLKYSNYYEHTVIIVSKLTGNPPPSLSREIEDRIKTMFKLMQIPFVKHCPPTRINFLSYSFVLHKTFQMLGYIEDPKYFEYMEYFELLKSRDKLRIQEEIWCKMCKDLGWQYYSSLDI